MRRPSCIDCRKEIDGKGVTPKDKKEWEKVKLEYEIWKCPVCNKKFDFSIYNFIEVCVIKDN